MGSWAECVWAYGGSNECKVFTYCCRRPVIECNGTKLLKGNSMENMGNGCAVYNMVTSLSP